MAQPVNSAEREEQKVEAPPEIKEGRTDSYL